MTPLSVILFAWAIVCTPHSFTAGWILAVVATLLQLAYAAGVGIKAEE